MRFIYENKLKSSKASKYAFNYEKWACSTLKAGKNKPVDYITKTRDLAGIGEDFRENKSKSMIRWNR